MELSGWGSTEFEYQREWDKPASHSDRKLLVPDYYLNSHKEHRLAGTKIERFPAYDLGYLLRKFHAFRTNLRHNTTGEWIAEALFKSASVLVKQVADTPEDAAANLAIELFKQGVITRDAA